jgi:hypothetical protein
VLAFDLRQFAKIAIPPKKVEGIIDEPVLATRGEFSLKFGKVGPSFMDNHHFTVNNRLTRNI